MPDQYRLITLAERPELAVLADTLALEVWPEFMLHDEVCGRNWTRMVNGFPDLQFALWDDTTNSLAAFANSLALHWDRPLNELPPGGIDWVIPKALDDLDSGRTPNIQCAVQVMIPNARQGQGFSSRMVRHMIDIGRAKGLTALIAPVRPSLKHRHPLVSIEEYVAWRNDHDQPFDPWLRVHTKLGGEIISICPRSMFIRGTIAEWERWTGMSFPSGGRHVIPGALVPVVFDYAKGEGVYVEPNVWTVHRLSGSGTP